MARLRVAREDQSFPPRVRRGYRVQGGPRSSSNSFVKLNGAIRLIAILKRLMNSRVLKFLLLVGKGIFVPILLKEIKGGLATVSNPLLERKQSVDRQASISVPMGLWLDSTRHISDVLFFTMPRRVIRAPPPC